MNRKRLPKVIRSAPDDGSETAPGTGAAEQQQAHAFAAGSKRSIDGEADSARPGDISLASVVQTHSSPVTRARATDTKQRRLLAYAIVERHSAYSAVGGIIPLPIVNMASITAIIVRMVKALSDLYSVPFERDRARAIVIGLMGGAMPTGLSAVTTSTLIYIVPGSNLIGLAISSIAGLACTRSIGRIFVDHFESGATLQEFSTVERT